MKYENVKNASVVKVLLVALHWHCIVVAQKERYWIKYSSIAANFFIISKSFCHKLFKFHVRTWESRYATWMLGFGVRMKRKVHKLFNREKSFLERDFCVFFFTIMKLFFRCSSLELGWFFRVGAGKICQKKLRKKLYLWGKKENDNKPCMNHKRKVFLAPFFHTQQRRTYDIKLP